MNLVKFARPTIVLAFSLSGCSPQENAQQNNTHQTQQENLKPEAVQPLPDPMKSVEETQRLIEEAAKAEHQARYPQKFERGDEILCMFYTNWAQQYKQSQSVSDPDLNAAQDYFTNRVIIASGETEANRLLSQHFNEIENLCVGQDGSCLQSLMRTMAERAPQCVAKFNQEVKLTP